MKDKKYAFFNNPFFLDGPYFEQGIPNTTVLFERASGKDFNLTCTVTKAIPTINNLTIVPEKGPNWRIEKSSKKSVSLIFTNANSQNNSRQFVCKATNNLTTSVLYFNTYVGGKVIMEKKSKMLTSFLYNINMHCSVRFMIMSASLSS